MARSRFTLFKPLTWTLFISAAVTLWAGNHEANAQPSVTAKPGEWRYCFELVLTLFRSERQTGGAAASPADGAVAVLGSEFRTKFHRASLPTCA